jgi:hypothetical protein
MIVFLKYHYFMKIITKENAIQHKLNTYYTGLPCKRNHYSKRYVSNNVCKDCLNELVRKKRAERDKRDECLQCGKKTSSMFKTCNNCLSNSRAWSAKLRKDTIEAYGGSCVCCKESNLIYLTIDHINNDGKTTIINGYRGGVRFYAQLRRAGFPEEFPEGSPLQILCANCHLAKSYFGGCNGQHILQKSKQHILND